jgi:lia operon protein LiaF
MENQNRKRNTAILLIAAGLFLLFGNLIGFFTVAALFIIWFAISKLRAGEDKAGYILLTIGILMLLSRHLSVIIAIILISLGYFYIKSKQIHKDGQYLQKQNFLESLKWNKDSWVLKSMSLWSVIGEINMDMSLALSEKEETTIILQGVIGDIDIIVPEELGVSVTASILFGQIDVSEQKEAGVMNKIVWQSSNYESSEHKVKIILSYIVGDIDIKVL